MRFVFAFVLVALFVGVFADIAGFGKFNKRFLRELSIGDDIQVSSSSEEPQNPPPDHTVWSQGENNDVYTYDMDSSTEAVSVVSIDRPNVGSVVRPIGPDVEWQGNQEPTTTQSPEVFEPVSKSKESSSAEKSHEHDDNKTRPDPRHHGRKIDDSAKAVSGPESGKSTSSPSDTKYITPQDGQPPQPQPLPSSLKQGLYPTVRPPTGSPAPGPTYPLPPTTTTPPPPPPSYADPQSQPQPPPQNQPIVPSSTPSGIQRGH